MEIKNKLTANKKNLKISIKSKNTFSFRMLLEKNKIYFETIVMIIVSVAGILVSIAGIQVSKMSNEISINSQKIENLEKQPYFVLSKEYTNDKQIFIMKNTGGIIHDGNVFMDKILIVSISNDNYEYIGKGYIYLSNYLTDGFSMYDADNKQFEFHQDLKPKPLSNLIDMINNAIAKRGYYSSIESMELYDLSYIDYKHDNINKQMIMRGGYFTELQKSELFEFRTIIDITDYDQTSIENDINEQIDSLIKFNIKH